MKVLKVIGVVAGAAALIATGAGAIGVGAVLGASTTSIAGIASLAAGVANIGAGLLQKPPPARGSVTQTIIDPMAPTPYLMGEGYFAGALRYQRSYGATLNKVPNPYRFKVVVYSGGGPVQSISPRVEFATIGSYYSGFLYTGTKLGACPDTALVPQFSGAPGWGTSSKLSGKACIGWSLKFDKDGKVFASGEPALGAYVQGVKVYDPRLDSTFPGGSGACRLGTESTYVYSANPALHAGTYAFGRYQNGKRVLGIGLEAEAIDWVAIAAWANTCDANGWAMFGVVYEPGDKWANLRDICIAGSGEPVLGAAMLGFHWDAPRTPLDTITAADLIADADRSVVAMPSWRERLNTIVPKGISPDHNWQQVQDEAVSVSSYVTEDGEIKQAEWAFSFVKDPDQRAELGLYRLLNSREIQPIELPCTQRLRAYRPGDCLDLDLMDELGLEGPAVILKRQFDPATMAVRLVMMTETAGKHALALGQTGTPPPTPALGLSAQQRDALISESTTPLGWASAQIRGAAIKNPRDTSDIARPLLQSAYSGGGLSTLSVARHDWDYPGLDVDTTREAHTFTGIPQDTFRYVYFDDETLTNGTVTYGLTSDPAQAQNSTANPNRHALGSILTANSGTGTVDGGFGLGYGLSVSEYL